VRRRRFTCAYRNTLAWKSETLPLPMENNPQLVFERLFGDGSTDKQRQERRNQAQSLLDSLRDQIPSLEKDLPAGDRRKLREYLEEVREIERRVKQFDDDAVAEHRSARRANGIPPTSSRISS
jgi:Spy/CpxP family protein refolding chaperone